MTMTKNSGGFRFRDPKDRDPYLDVCEATRIALDRAAEQSLTGGDLRIILAVVHLLTARSRMWDYTSHKQIAEIAKVHRRSAIRSIKKLVEVEVVKWTPGGPGVCSKVALPDVVTKKSHHASARKTAPLRVVIDGVEMIRNRDGGLEEVTA